MAAPKEQQLPTLNLNMILDQVAKDKGIARHVLVDTLQNAIAQAAKKHFGPDRAIEAVYNAEKGVAGAFQTRTVFERADSADALRSVNETAIEDAGTKGIEAEIGGDLL